MTRQELIHQMALMSDEELEQCILIFKDGGTTLLKDYASSSKPESNEVKKNLEGGSLENEPDQNQQDLNSLITHYINEYNKSGRNYARNTWDALREWNFDSNHLWTDEDKLYLSLKLKEINFDPEVVLYAMATESRVDPNPRNRLSSAKGLTLLTNDTLEKLSRKYKKDDPGWFEKAILDYKKGTRSTLDAIDDMVLLLNDIYGNIDKSIGTTGYGRLKVNLLAPSKGLNDVVSNTIYNSSLTPEQLEDLKDRQGVLTYGELADYYDLEFERNKLSAHLEERRKKTEELQEKSKDRLLGSLSIRKDGGTLANNFSKEEVTKLEIGGWIRNIFKHKPNFSDTPTGRAMSNLYDEDALKEFESAPTYTVSYDENSFDEFDKARRQLEDEINAAMKVDPNYTETHSKEISRKIKNLRTRFPGIYYNQRDGFYSTLGSALRIEDEGPTGIKTKPLPEVTITGNYSPYTDKLYIDDYWNRRKLEDPSLTEQDEQEFKKWASEMNYHVYNLDESPDKRGYYMPGTLDIYVSDLSDIHVRRHEQGHAFREWFRNRPGYNEHGVLEHSPNALVNETFHPTLHYINNNMADEATEFETTLSMPSEFFSKLRTAYEQELGTFPSDDQLYQYIRDAPDDLMDIIIKSSGYIKLDIDFTPEQILAWKQNILKYALTSSQKPAEVQTVNIAKNGGTLEQQLKDLLSEKDYDLLLKYVNLNELADQLNEMKEITIKLEEEPKSVKLHKSGGSLIDLLKDQLGDSEIIDLLQHFGIDELMEGGLKNTGKTSISITIISDDNQKEEEGHKIPKLKKIEIGDKTYEVEIVTSEEDMEKGLGGRDSLDKDKGMLFDFGEVLEDIIFNMEEMKFPLDIIFINDDDEVIRVAKDCQPGKDLFREKNVRYVLEVNINSGINKGDEFNDSPEEEVPVMKVLAPDGSTLMELKGGERIFSRVKTRQLIKWAKKAEASQKDSDFKRLGNIMFKEIKAQDGREAEYVEVPEN